MALIASRQLSAAAFVAAGLAAQAQVAPLPSFEAASVKQHRAGERTRNTILPGGRYSATNVPVLEDRFHLVTHRETRDVPMYALTAVSAGTLGGQIRPASRDCPPPAPPAPPRCGIFVGIGEIRGVSATLAQLASALAPIAGRLVQDRTVMPGTYDFEMQFEFQPVPDPGRPSLFTAVREQLGVKLDPATGPVEVVVIDRIDRPSED